MRHEGSTAALITGLDVDEALRSLHSRLRRVLKPRDFSANHRLLSVTLRLPPIYSAVVPQSSAGAVYWHRPADRRFRVATGSAFTVSTSGAMRFRQLAEQFAELSSKWLRIDGDDTGIPPRATLGFAFCPVEPPNWQGLPNAQLQLPAVLIEGDRDTRAITFSCAHPRQSGLETCISGWLRYTRALLSPSPASVPGGSGDQGLSLLQRIPTEERWLQQVEDARRMIADGQVEKLVLTRRLRVQAMRPLSPARLLQWLEGHYPQCTHFMYAVEGGALVSASPERLVTLEGGRVRSDAVASTTVRTQDAEENHYLEQELLANPKARHEHRLVVDAIVRALRPLCRRLHRPPDPAVMRLQTLQHLWTPLEGEVRAGVSLLDCAERLHPTPAVGGLPRTRALAWLSSRGERRGWYTGGFGWMTAHGEGDLAVVLRCAMLRGAQAEVYAGAGIVAGSDPQAELAETKLKMRVMLDALAQA